jgi:hypothetical protein
VGKELKFAVARLLMGQLSFLTFMTATKHRLDFERLQDQITVTYDTCIVYERANKAATRFSRVPTSEMLYRFEFLRRLTLRAGVLINQNH